MTISNAVLGNLTSIYLFLFAAMKAYSLAAGRSFGGGYVLAFSSAVVAAILIGSLAWDVSRKATQALMARENHHEMCRGGICWHGVAAKSPASEVRFRLPHHHNL
ncbi:hypothetical protein SASPL_149892 [Salvia splendens]|uniref:Uncharacterized protein n=1 Tax=Salvia splendens TaxID=180675 RepID=A0A8X8Z1I5_SALSN|nr:uncharacterized protein LOC121782723 [Salvia splendens]KAG6388466.1 hypothetical protein SASPL_149892 [Salvia splendens]